MNLTDDEEASNEIVDTCLHQGKILADNHSNLSGEKMQLKIAAMLVQVRSAMMIADSIDDFRHMMKKKGEEEL